MPSPPSPWQDAPLFHLFWHNGELNPARAEVMRARIAEDAARVWSPPRPLHAAAGVALPDPVHPGDALAQRHSGRRFGDARWGVQELGRVLAPLRARPGDSDTRRLPSGGAKYPIQAYAALYGTDDAIAAEPGIHWYDPIGHALVPVAPCPAWPALSRLLGVDWPERPAAVLFLIAEPAGTLTKYGERGGRFVLIEAGVWLGALGQEVAAMHAAGCAIGSFEDAAVLALLGLDPQRHLAVLAYACGPAP
jgi:SagB-type dehydrogenase family enzyme